MSEGQFAYSGFTLDELRSLASSPQVGTMQAMPQSFRALADRVGEVADLLTHAQADLPNWWKGPAADQAAATLGRAAAEAREFHDSATGAATAVGRCAQVVAEQQHQMMNVPQVPEPGITDVVQRPTTPFEALEAARQDASYQAAHEQAVQIVNGIAAQYVETRGQLTATILSRGEDFETLAPGHQSTASEATPNEGKLFATPPSAAAPLKKEGFTRSLRQSRGESIGKLREFSRRMNSANLPPSTDRVRIRDESVISLHPEALTATRNTESNLYTREPDTEKGPLPSPWTATIEAPNESPRDEPPSGLIREGLEPGEPSEFHVDNKSCRMSRQDSQTQGAASKRSRDRTDSSSETDDLTSFGESDYHPLPISGDQTSPPSKPAGNFPSDITNEDASTIIPPYSGVGSVSTYRERENRGLRPTYLKERKSAWLPDTIAAPPDGIITPDWLELR
ncbi:WXG100 family type VII secretion target [Catenulispora rubra]|uniref:WXG100 family type VII secretion target n=1 Tax=Catenulispora rubra TaxID=280293 RepID=UPI00189201B8|nr:hypothetical protein [Catenulispora rubra]